MKVLVTGVGGQLGHDVMNELASRGYEGIGSDIKETYSGIQDGTAVTTMPYVTRCIFCRKSSDRCKTGCSGTLCCMDGRRSCRRRR